MSLSNLDTYDNRVALDKWLNEKWAPWQVVHGYNSISGIVLSDYSKTKSTSNGFSHIVQFKIQNQTPVAPEFVAIFIADTKETQEAIDFQIDSFFNNQTTIDNEMDEEYVRMKIERLQEDYRKKSRIIQPVEVIMEIKSISRANNGSTTIAGYVTREAWINVDGIAQYEDQRQVVLIPFDKWFAWLELIDPNRHEKIKRERTASVVESVDYAE